MPSRAFALGAFLIVFAAAVAWVLLDARRIERDRARRRAEELERSRGSECKVCGACDDFSHNAPSYRRRARHVGATERSRRPIWRCSHTSHASPFEAERCAVRTIAFLQHGNGERAIQLRAQLQLARRRPSAQADLSPKARAEAKRTKNREHQREFRKRHPGCGTELTRRWRGSHPAEYAATKARYRGAKHVELVIPSTCFTRDNWICHICGGKVEMDEASLDHIKPIALGGDHTAENLACSHRRCNHRKRHREAQPCASCGEEVMPGAPRCRWCGALQA